MAVDDFSTSDEESTKNTFGIDQIKLRNPGSISVFSDDFWLQLTERSGLGVTETSPLADTLQFQGPNGHSQPPSELNFDDGIVLVDCPLPDDLERFDIAKISRSGKLFGAHFIILTTFERIQSEVGSLPHEQSGEEATAQLDSEEHELSDTKNDDSNNVAAAPDLDLQYIEKTIIFLELLLEKFRNVLIQREINAGFFGAGSKIFSRNLRSSGKKTIKNPSFDARLIREIIKKRQQRGKIFDWEDFSDPSWDILLDLTAAHLENKKVSVTDLIFASGVPATTALRLITRMERSGLIGRSKDEMDGRRSWVQLSDRALKSIMRYFLSLDNLEEAFL